MRDINSLDFADISGSIEKVKEIRKKKRENDKICFLVTSVIFPSTEQLNYSKVRTVYGVDERIEQTIQSIRSIRERCPNADIILVDAGMKNPKDSLEPLVDFFIYLGDEKRVRKAVNSKFKGLGEAEMILGSFAYIKDYEFVFKLSGRYQLNESFAADNYDFERFNFKNYVVGRPNLYGEAKYIKGSHSTRLYGVPVRFYADWEKALRRCRWKMKLGIGIENAMAGFIKGDKFFYQKVLGVSGKVAVNGEEIKE